VFVICQHELRKHCGSLITRRSFKEEDDITISSAYANRLTQTPVTWHPDLDFIAGSVTSHNIY